MLARTAVFASDRGEATRIAHAALQDLTRTWSTSVRRSPGSSASRRTCTAFPTTTPARPGRGRRRTGARALAAALSWEEVCRGEDRARAVDAGPLRPGASDPAGRGPRPALGGRRHGAGHGRRGHHRLLGARAPARLPDRRLLRALAVHLWLGYVQWQHGDLPDALQSMVQCTEQNELWGSNYAIGQTYADAFMVCMLLDRGSLDEAQNVVDLAHEGLPDRRRRPAVRRGPRQGRAHPRGPRQALATLESLAGEMTVMRNPVWRPWRSMRARVLARLGRLDEAVELVTEELVLARRWGSPQLVGQDAAGPRRPADPGGRRAAVGARRGGGGAARDHPQPAGPRPGLCAARRALRLDRPGPGARPARPGPRPGRDLHRRPAAVDRLGAAGRARGRRTRGAAAAGVAHRLRATHRGAGGRRRRVPGDRAVAVRHHPHRHHDRRVGLRAARGRVARASSRAALDRLPAG